MKLSKIFWILLFSTTTIFAQKDIKTTQVRVVEGFIPVIPEASRLNENAIFADTIKRDRTQNYEVLDVELKSAFKTRPLKAAIVKADKIPRLFGKTISFGTGYKIASKASLIYNSQRSKEVSFGMLFSHINNNVEVDQKEAGKSQNDFYLYSKIIKNNHVYFASMKYQRKGVYTYGLGTLDKKDFNHSISKNNPFYNRFAFTKFLLSKASVSRESTKLKYNTTFFISDLNERSENHIHLSSNLSKTINGLPLNITIVLDDYLYYNNPDISIESIAVQSFELEPSISFSRYSMDFDLGLELYYFSDSNPIGIAPNIQATKEIVEDVLLFYGGLRHSSERNTIKSISDKNPYIHTFGTNQSFDSDNIFLQELRHTDMDELYVVMRNVLSKDEVCELGTSFARAENFVHFRRIDTAGYSRFRVEYIESLLQLAVNANYSRKINHIVSINASVDYYDWSEDVYYKPNFTFNINIPFNLRNKIIFSPEIIYNSSRLSYAASLPSSLYSNIELDYIYSKQFSAYFQFNNITNSNQEIWSGYKDIGFNAVFGLSYSF